MRIKLHYLLILSVLGIGLSNCKNSTNKTEVDSRTAVDAANQAFVLHELNNALTEAVIQDGHKPPVGTRIYAYPNVAAYESLIPSSKAYRSLAGQLKGLNSLPKPDLEKYDARIAMVQSFYTVAIEMVYRDYIIEQKMQQLLDTLKPSVDKETFEYSIALGKQTGNVINKWAKSDGFIKIQNMPNYTVSNEPGHWKPTPPMYGEACEPHWFKVRLFSLDSIQQFNAPPPPEFSTEKGSDFYKSVMEVYDISQNLTKEQEETAWFWNDLPSNSQIQGHLMTTKRQISPPGHWMNITELACKKKDLNLNQAAEAYAMVGIAMADAFKANWYTKYFYDLIRPVTYINEYIDPSWTPLLETPMFPEYTSAHSTMSAAAAAVLSTLVDSNMAFVDSSEIAYGYTARAFDSFYDAAWEVTMSRVYGGIHYTVACQVGSQVGHEIGKYILHHTQTREEDFKGKVPDFSVYRIRASLNKRESSD